MKKSHYLQYLKDFQAKKRIEVTKTFKNGKKQSSLHYSKNTNPKSKEHKILNRLQSLFENQRQDDKQNQHPNFMKENHMQLKIDQRYPFQGKSQGSYHELKRQWKDKVVRQKEFSINLSKCNFEQSHDSSNLFLVQAESNSELIVCEQCSKRFTKRVSINNFSLQKPKHSYSKLVQVIEKLELKNKKLSRVMLAQKQSIERTINEVSLYYNELVRVIIQKKTQLQAVLIEAYNRNESTIHSLMKKNQEKINFVNYEIEKWEKRCTKQIYDSYNIDDENCTGQMDAIMEELTKGDQIELSCISQKIPMEILSDFEQYFAQSKYCINLLRNHRCNQIDQDDENHKLKNTMLSSKVNQLNKQNYEQHPQLIDQVQEYQEQPFEPNNKINLSPDYEKQIPFNVQYSETTQKPVNFSHKIDQNLSKMSSSEQLLIDSLRNHDSYPKLNTNLSAPFIHPSKHRDSLNKLEKDLNSTQNDYPEKELNDLGKGLNFKTQSSTCRTLPPENTNGKLNFVKQLHIEQEDLTDLICDEDLTLSSSHPIHDNPIHKNQILPRKSLKLSYNPNKRNQQPLTLQQLSSEISQTQKFAEILNPSTISANENKHQISFELDENMLIDANILPTQEIDQENLDIISPAFKII